MCRSAHRRREEVHSTWHARHARATALRVGLDEVAVARHERTPRLDVLRHDGLRKAIVDEAANVLGRVEAQSVFIASQPLKVDTNVGGLGSMRKEPGRNAPSGFLHPPRSATTTTVTVGAPLEGGEPAPQRIVLHYLAGCIREAKSAFWLIHPP